LSRCHAICHAILKKAVTVFSPILGLLVGVVTASQDKTLHIGSEKVFFYLFFFLTNFMEKAVTR